ncbi:MAG: membrane protein insertion efficiency factor YidD [Desulfovibrio sp.]|nr:membrane protein insertion efficiency factor YidD [Desulfovibrio sp.]
MKGMLPRIVAVAPIRLYQYYISPLLPACCRYYPSCSAYAREAVLRHGVRKGGLLALLRLMRCHPWGGAGGYDPVPPIQALLRKKGLSGGAG